MIAVKAVLAVVGEKIYVEVGVATEGSFGFSLFWQNFFLVVF